MNRIKVLKRPFGIITTLSCLLFKTAIGQASCPVIPFPAEAKAQGNFFSLNKQTSLLVADESLRPVAYYLQQQLLQKNEIPLSIQSASATPAIKLSLAKKVKGSDESYSLFMNSREILITSSSSKGVFYGVVSLLQLISQSKTVDETINVNCWNITDEPRYGWRGLMLDESRHFFGKEKVKSILDWMAFIN